MQYQENKMKTRENKSKNEISKEYVAKKWNIQ